MSRLVRAAWLLLLLSACGCNDERIVFQEVIKSECAPPCWRGVIPGSTNRPEMLDLLRVPPDSDTGMVMSWGDTIEWGKRCVDRRYSPPQVTINVDPEDVVQSITLVEPDQRYTFQHAFDEFWPPVVV